MQQNKIPTPGRFVMEFADGRFSSIIFSEEFRNSLADASAVESMDNWMANIHPDDKTMVEAVLQEVVDQQLDAKDIDIEFRVNTKYGYRLFHVSITVDRAADGKPQRAMGIVFDITDLTEEKEHMNAEINKAYAIIEGLSHEYHTIWTVDKDTQEMSFIRSNGTTLPGAIFLGRNMPTWDQAVYMYVENFVVPEEREAIHKIVTAKEIIKQLEQQPVYTVTFRRIEQDGSTSHHQITFANADTKDGKHQFVFALRNIDQAVLEEEAKQKQLEEALEMANAANDAKTSFLFNMSHDIRTPMNAILGFTRLLRKHQEKPEKREDYLNKIENSSTVLLSILNNVLEMARIEKGRVELIESPVSAKAFGQSITSMFSERMEEKGLTFNVHANTKHDFVFLDETKMREVLINLLSNAYKYTLKGSVDVSIDELPHEKEGYIYLRATVKDTGIGMTEEFLPHVFEEFSREINPAEHKIEGTGLGMPIVKRLVDLMGGTIEVESKFGEGSTFTVTIPHHIAEGLEDKIENTTEVYNIDELKGHRILMTEDNDLNAEIALELFGEVGLVVDRVTNGKECVEQLEKAPANYYEAILMDIQMPLMNGYEATEAIRKMADSSKANIPILALTANAFEEDKRKAKNAGMNEHIGKPIDLNEVLRKLAKFIL